MSFVGSARTRGIHDTEVFVFAEVPGVRGGVREPPLALFLCRRRIAEEIRDFLGEVVCVAGFEKSDHVIGEIELIDFGAGGDDWNAHGHEFHYFGAVSLVAEGIGAFWDEADIGICDFIDDFTDGEWIEEPDVCLEAEFLGELNPRLFHIPITIDVKLCVRELSGNGNKRADGDIESLMFLQTAGEDGDELIVSPSARAR